MKNHVSFVFVWFVFMAFSVVAQQTDFEKFNAGSRFNDKAWESDGFVNIDWFQGSDRAMVSDDFSHGGKKSLRVFYPKGKFGPGETGHQAPCGLTPADEYYVSYWLRFSEDFSWGTENQGGKLPGLASGEKCSGGQTCDGSNGFTARYMWREDGRAVLYLYHMDKPGKYGEDFDLTGEDGEKSYFPKGEWINLIERVKINSGNNHDGEVQIWYNGKEVLHLSGLKFVTNGDKVDAFYFSTFHGGNDITWSPKNDCYIWFDDIIVTRDPKNVFTSSSLTTP
ncbi:MAG: hypothetical protein JXB24_11545 [Bacteroidales bacterium]|nr:hypothetical protein [Bacteroidales bacterium]